MLAVIIKIKNLKVDNFHIQPFVILMAGVNYLSYIQSSGSRRNCSEHLNNLNFQKDFLFFYYKKIVCIGAISLFFF